MQRQSYCARTPTTHQLISGEETVMKPIRRPMGKFGQDVKFLMTTGSGPRFNVSPEGQIPKRNVLLKTHLVIFMSCSLFTKQIWIWIEYVSSSTFLSNTDCKSTLLIYVCKYCKSCSICYLVYLSSMQCKQKINILKNNYRYKNCFQFSKINIWSIHL